jgi:hypothetical protein
MLRVTSGEPLTFLQKQLHYQIMKIGGGKQE